MTRTKNNYSAILSTNFKWNHLASDISFERYFQCLFNHRFLYFWWSLVTSRKMVYKSFLYKYPKFNNKHSKCKGMRVQTSKTLHIALSENVKYLIDQLKTLMCHKSLWFNAPLKLVFLTFINKNCFWNDISFIYFLILPLILDIYLIFHTKNNFQYFFFVPSTGQFKNFHKKALNYLHFKTYTFYCLINAGFITWHQLTNKNNKKGDVKYNNYVYKQIYLQ